MDSSIQNELWSGKVPMELILAGEDISSFEPPDCQFILAPRYSYLSIIAKDSLNYFQQVGVEIEYNIWFESNLGNKDIENPDTYVINRYIYL